MIRHQLGKIKLTIQIIDESTYLGALVLSKKGANMGQIKTPPFTKKLMKMLVIVMLSMLAVTSISITAYADGYDFDEGDPSAAGSKSLMGGPNWSWSGVIFYLVDETGNSVGVSPIVYTTSYDGFTDRNGNQISAKNIRVYPRLFITDVGKVKTGAIDLWGPPWGSGGTLRGVEIREWLVTTADNGHSRAANLVKEEWGEFWAEKYENKEVYLVFEAVGWNNIYCNGVNTGTCVAGTSRFWSFYGYYLYVNGLNTTKGDPMVNLYTNDKYHHCMLLNGEPETTKMGLHKTPTRSGKQTSEYLMEYMNGWGMGVVWDEDEAINTYSPPEGSPGKAEDPNPGKVGTTTIVKGYYTEDELTQTKISDGVYTQPNTTNKINIMEEPEYQLVSWNISTDAPTTPDPAGSR